MPSADATVIVVGGGIAGLACACRLHAQGVSIQVLDASGSVGGRIKTDRLDDGTTRDARAVVVATEGPATSQLIGLPSVGGSVAETCLYCTCDRAGWHTPFLMRNGDGKGLINTITVPSAVAPTYAPEGKSLVSVVVIGNPDIDDAELIDRVNGQLRDWFGHEAAGWKHLATYRIAHALPDQSPPTPDPSRPPSMVRPGIFVCGEYGSLPGIQWAMVSGRRTADAVRAQVTNG